MRTGPLPVTCAGVLQHPRCGGRVGGGVGVARDLTPATDVGIGQPQSGSTTHTHNPDTSLLLRSSAVTASLLLPIFTPRLWHQRHRLVDKLPICQVMFWPVGRERRSPGLRPIRAARPWALSVPGLFPPLLKESGEKTDSQVLSEAVSVLFTAVSLSARHRTGAPYGTIEWMWEHPSRARQRVPLGRHQGE